MVRPMVPTEKSTGRFPASSPTYDVAGNLTYDGLQCYTYDAWNRPATMAHGYRDAAGVHSGGVLSTSGYDGRGRRISKAITGTGSLDCTYQYYYDQDSPTETRNGSDIAIKQQVWGLQYVDELVQVQVAVNSDQSTDNSCDALYWVCQDANYNVLGLVDNHGVLAERYEYTPYGQRTVFFSPGVNDVGCYASTLTSRKIVVGGVPQPYGLCEFGHQGLQHDEESGLVYNRIRILLPALGRFMQRDPLGQPGTVLQRDTLGVIAVAANRTRANVTSSLGRTRGNTPLLWQYADGMNLYLDELGNPIHHLDWQGTEAIDNITCMDECDKNWIPGKQNCIDCYQSCALGKGPTKGVKWPWWKCLTKAIIEAIF